MSGVVLSTLAAMVGPGLLIGATFGLVYVLVNAGALPGPVALVLRVLAAVAYAGLVVTVFRLGRPSPGSGGGGVRFSRGYWVVVGAEVAAFIIGNAVLSGPLGRPEAVLPWVTTVVGVHFLVLARVWRTASIAWQGAALSACGVLALVLAFSSAGPVAIATVAAVVPGFLLLAGSWWGVLAIKRGLVQPAATH